MVYAVGDEFDPANARSGTVFQGGTTGSCWGGCHVHIELDNTDGAACYNVLPPIDGIAIEGTVGQLGGALGGGHCFRGAPRVPYAREYWVVSSNATRDQFLELARQAYAGRNTVGFSYDDAESATSPSARSSSGARSSDASRLVPAALRRRERRVSRSSRHRHVEVRSVCHSRADEASRTASGRLRA